MRVGVVDVGSNTVRLLVAERATCGVARVREERSLLSLGAEIERHGKVPARKIAQTAEAVADYLRLARTAGAADLSVLITSPGRQARNGTELAERVVRSTGALVRMLTAEDEGRLAYTGTLAQSGERAGVVAVCDVGGGSSQIAIGTDPAWPGWVRSVDIGSLRLTRRFVAGDPPTAKELRAARACAAGVVDRLVLPVPHTAFATGGTARALARIVGRTLDEETLAEALAIVSREPSKAIARRHGIQRWRAGLLPAGTIVLLEAQRRLGVPLEVARGGLREGAALELLQRAAAVA